MANSSFTILRNLLPPVFAGPKFNAVLAGISEGDDFLQQNSIAVYQNSFIVSASGAQLDILLGSRGI